MIPRSVFLHGITCLRDVNLELDELPPGLICVRGENGAGKTTLMEAMGPASLYRRFPSRDTRRGLLEVATARDAVVDVTWDYDGREVRALHQVDPEHGGGRGKAEAYLWFDGVPLSEGGRLPDYDAAVRGLFPPPAVLLASAFAAQNGAGDFARLSTAERRDLFAALLGLDELQDLSARAREHRKRLDAAADELERRGAELRACEARAVELQTEIDDRLEQVERSQVHVAGKVQEAEQDEQLHRDLQAQLNGANAARAAYLRSAERLERHLQDAGRRLQAARAELDALPDTDADLGHLEQLERKLQARSDELAELRATYSAARDAARVARQAAQAAQDRRQLDDAEADRIAGELDGLADVPLVELQARLARARAWEGAARDRRNAKVHSGRDPEHVEHLLDDARKRARLVDRVPCMGQDLDVTFDDGEDPPDGVIRCSACPLLADATSARARIPELEQELARAELAVAAELEGDAGLLLAIEIRTDAERAVRAGERRAPLVESLESARRRAALAIRDAQKAISEAETAEEAVATADRRGREIRDELQALPDLGKVRELRDAEARRPALQAGVEQLAGEQDRWRRELLELVDPGEPTQLRRRVTEAGDRAQRSRQAATDAQIVADGVRDGLSRARGALDALGDLVARRTAHEVAVRDVRLRRVGFVLVERATGRDGIQALEVDAAGPEVSTVATELLSSCYRSRFALELRTIREAEGSRQAREVFDLVVHDGRGGGAMPFESLSGGEQVICSEALKIAIAVFNARRSGALQTLWRDEADGRLDPANAAAYPAMLRRALELGGFHRVYYVSHRPEVQAQADGAIVVGGGTARLEL